MPSYGIWQEKDLQLENLATEVDRDALLDAQLETVASHNQEVNTFVGLFCDRVTVPQTAVRTGANNRLQPLDENGRPQAVKAPGQYIVGFPLWKAGTAEGWNFWTHEQMSVRQFADSLNLMLKGDVAWMRDQILAPMFYNGAGFPYVNAKTGETFTVFGMANGDTVVYDSSNGAATDSHYAAQAAAIDAANNPLDAIYDDLVEHPENTGRIVAFVPPGAIPTAIKLLAGFSPATRNIIEVIPGSATATQDPLEAPGLNLPLSRSMTYLGVHNNLFIVQWQNMPAGYIVAVAVDAADKPLGMREYPQPKLQGLVNLGEPMSRFPYQQNNFVRAAGFGGRNRTAAFVQRIGNASYAAPTALPFPIA
jgi:hypothetical protein